MTAPPETVRIFLAEDNPADVYLIERALTTHNIAFELQVASDGKQALACLSAADPLNENKPPSLILLDLNLPRHDGAEILQYIRGTEKFCAVPVVILTSSDSPADQMAAMQTGANRFIRKPSNLQDFMNIGAALKELLNT